MRKLFTLVSPAAARLFCLPKLNAIYRQVTTGDDTDAFVREVLDYFHVQVNLALDDRALIPAEGPVIVVANHPFGAIEGLILAQVLREVRPDVKIMANYFLTLIPELADLFIAVDPFGTREALAKNIGPLKQAMGWIRKGGMLGIFPAGEVSSLSLKKRKITDKEWSETVGRIARRTKVPVLPIYFGGSNRLIFHLLGLVHPRLRTVMLPREFLNAEQKSIDMAIGSLIPASKVASFDNDRELVDYLMLRTFMLGKRYGKKKQHAARALPDDFEPIAPARDPDLLEAEIDTLPDENVVLNNGEYKIFVARRGLIPNVVEEIGRLRELTFRQVGEGTGRKTDLDSFDDTYLHMGLWNIKNREIAGSYRIGLTDEIMREKGRSGLYVHTLFKLKKNFLESIDPALEMGRSFVLKKYQKSYAPLVLLWKGIAEFVYRRKKYSVLYGPVSISSDYHSMSRDLIVRFLSNDRHDEVISRFVKAKTPPKKTKPFSAQGMELSFAQSVVKNLDDLANLISDIESDHKGVPVLLRHYLKLGGKLLSFNVDQDFNDALDGLIYVDLMQTDPKILARFMGRDKAREFLAYHNNPGAEKI